MHSHQRRTIVYTLFGLGLLSGHQPVAAQQSTEVDRVLETTAIIESVDQKTRQIVLRREDGSYVTFIATKAVRNFAQIRPGDQVHARYESALAARLGKPGDTLLSDQDLSDSAVAELGEKPYGERAVEIRRKIAVTAVDSERNTLSFIDPDSKPRVIFVRTPQMRAFLRTLKPGDTVDVSFREAAMVDVEPAH